jgi:MFS family permease
VTRFATGRLWRHPGFLKLWSAQTVSQLGTQVSLLAIPIIGASLLHLDPLSFALLGAIEFVPFLLFALPAGAYADRLPRRAMLIVTDLGRALVLASIPAAFVLGSLTIGQLYIAAFVAGTLTVFFEVAYLAYLPELVERDEILEGNAKLEVTRSASQVAGPGVAGYLISLIGAPLAILADSASFLASAALVLAIPRTQWTRTVAGDGARVGLRREIVEGLQFVLGHRLLRAIAACTALSNLFSNLAYAILVLYLVRALGLGPETIGLVFAVGNFGLLLGAFLGQPLGARLGVGWAIIASAVLFGPSTALVALSAVAPAWGVQLVTTGIFLGSACQVTYNINQVSLRQAVTPDAMQGRMSATMRFIVFGTIPIGVLAGGFLATAIGLGPAIGVGAVGGMVGFVPVLLSPLRGVRTMPTSADEADPARAIGHLSSSTSGTRADIPGSPGSNAAP